MNPVDSGSSPVNVTSEQKMEENQQTIVIWNFPLNSVIVTQVMLEWGGVVIMYESKLRFPAKIGAATVYKCSFQATEVKIRFQQMLQS